MVTAGAGSVLSLWGNAGDPVVEVTHIKQPAVEVGPWQIVHDHDVGVSRLYEADTLPGLLARHATEGLTGCTDRSQVHAAPLKGARAVTVHPSEARHLAAAATLAVLARGLQQPAARATLAARYGSDLCDRIAQLAATTDPRYGHHAPPAGRNTLPPPQEATRADSARAQ
jgi:hypothetical protein